MKKSAIIIILIGIILVAFGFVFFRIQAFGPDNNYFNTHLRGALAQSPALRQILGLHYEGDGKSDYLGGRYKKILIEVGIMNTLDMQLSGLNLLSAKIQQVTGKPTSYIISDKNIPYQKSLSTAAIAHIVTIYRNYKSSGDTAALYLLYASRDEDVPITLGKTYQEYGLILYGDELKDFTVHSPATLANYQESTALHEFGHQLGLVHDNLPGCLMNERAEQSHVAAEKPQDVVIDFCTYEKSLIRN